MKSMSLGLKQALQLVREHIRPLPGETVTLEESIGRVAACDIVALVDSPSVDVSRKDGYAVISADLADATPEQPVILRVRGAMAAGGTGNLAVVSGTAVRVLTGARIPAGADAVVAEEYTTGREGGLLKVDTPVRAGKNVLPRGGDVAMKHPICRAGARITPILAGLLAVAGHHRIPVHQNPVIAVVGTGDEIVAPGNPLAEGQVYASNVVTLSGWCKKYGMISRQAIVRDDDKAIRDTIEAALGDADALITSGGAWTGDYDMVSHVLDMLRWKRIFHRIRIGPGKAVGFGLLEQKPVFILPGGPPSNLMGFLQIALPGLLALSGRPNAGLPAANARLAADIPRGKTDWTDFFFGTFTEENDLPVFHPMKKRSRLFAIATADAVAAIPEGQESLARGSVIPVQLLG